MQGLIAGRHGALTSSSMAACVVAELGQHLGGVLARAAAARARRRAARRPTDRQADRAVVGQARMLGAPTSMPLASVCGSAATWSSVRMGADGTPARCRRAEQLVGGRACASRRASASQQRRAVRDARAGCPRSADRAASSRHPERRAAPCTKSASEPARDHHPAVARPGRPRRARSSRCPSPAAAAPRRWRGSWLIWNDRPTRARCRTARW